jgi:hypothetical protein
MSHTYCTVKSMTSGRPIPALVRGESKLRKILGWGYIKVDVMMTSIANKHSISTNWYKPSELTYL